MFKKFFVFSVFNFLVGEKEQREGEKKIDWKITEGSWYTGIRSPLPLEMRGYLYLSASDF